MASPSSSRYPDPFGLNPWYCKTCGLRLQVTHGIGPPKTSRFDPRLSNTLPPSQTSFNHRLICFKCLKYDDTNMISQLALQRLCTKCNCVLSPSTLDYHGLKTLATHTSPTLPPCVLSSCGRPATHYGGFCEKHYCELPFRRAMYEQQKGSLKTGVGNFPPWAMDQGWKDSSPNIGNFIAREKTPHGFGHNSLNASLYERAKNIYPETPSSKPHPLRSGSFQEINIDPSLLRKKTPHQFEHDGLYGDRYERAKTTRPEKQQSKPYPLHSGTFQKINIDPSLLRKLQHPKRYQPPGFTQDGHLPCKYI